MRGTDEKTCAQSREELGKSPLSAWPETPYLGIRESDTGDKVGAGFE
jgi:hypothetical protein